MSRYWKEALSVRPNSRKNTMTRTYTVQQTVLSSVIFQESLILNQPSISNLTCKWPCTILRYGYFKGIFFIVIKLNKHYVSLEGMRVFKYLHTRTMMLRGFASSPPHPSLLPLDVHTAWTAREWESILTCTSWTFTPLVGVFYGESNIHSLNAYTENAVWNSWNCTVVRYK